MVVTDVAFENPYAKDVLILTNNYDGDAHDLVSFIELEVFKYGYSIQEIWKLAKNVYGEEIFDIYNGTVGVDSKDNNGRKSNNRQNDGTLSDNENGKRTFARGSKADREIKLSLKDSVGNTLSQEQAEFFKDSNEDVVKIVREDILEHERTESTYKESLFWENLYGEELVSEYSADSFGSYQEIKTGRWRPGSRIDGRRIDENGQLVQDRRGSSSEVETNEKISFSLKEDTRFKECCILPDFFSNVLSFSLNLCIIVSESRLLRLSGNWSSGVSNKFWLFLFLLIAGQSRSDL